MAFRYFGSVAFGITPEELIKQIETVISGDMISEPIRLSKSTACQIGWRVFVANNTDIVYLKLVGDAIFEP